jgi:hypothetical protein
VGAGCADANSTSEPLDGVVDEPAPTSIRAPLNDDPRVAAAGEALAAGRGRVAEHRSLAATRDVLKKRADQRARSASRHGHRRLRSPSCRGQAPDEVEDDAASACLHDIVRRGDLLSQLHQALRSWSLLATQVRNDKAPDVTIFKPGDEVDVVCLSGNDSFVWAYEAEVVDADFEAVELEVAGATKADVIGWDSVRTGAVQILHADSELLQYRPPP